MLKVKINTQIYNYITLPIKHHEALEVTIHPLNKEKSLLFKPSDTIEIHTPRTPEAIHIKLLFLLMNSYAETYRGKQINELAFSWWSLRSVYSYINKPIIEEKILGALNDLCKTEIIVKANSKDYSLKFIKEFKCNEKEVAIIFDKSFVDILSPPTDTSKAKKKKNAIKFLPSELMEVSNKNIVKFNLLCYMLLQKKPIAKETTLLNIINCKKYLRKGKQYYKHGVAYGIKQVEDILEVEELENKDKEKLFKWKYRGEKWER